MNDAASKALLPDGLRDVLSPDAAHEASVVDRLLSRVEGWGYERVDPPLVEFEDSLLGGAGEGVALATFRLMDPVSQRMMGVRADMTPQVARIAGSRLRKAPRPLRLAYAGHVLRVRGDQLRPERQFFEVGVELIGADGVEADVEIIALAAKALSGIGVEGLSVDINLPTLTPAICLASGLDERETEGARAALDRKDAAAVAAIGGDASVLLGGLLAAAGPAGSALDALAKIDLPAAVRTDCDRLGDAARRIAAAAPGLVEHRGFEYHTGLSFTLFAAGVRGSLGRGGRYGAGSADEPATGFTLFLDSIMRAVPAPVARRRLYLPYGTPASAADALREEDWIAVMGFDPVVDDAIEARRLGCSHVLGGQGPVPTDETQTG